MSDTVSVFAPASIANLGCGFDILSLAVKELGDYVVVSKIPQFEIVIKNIEGDGGKLPYEAIENTASLAAMHILIQLVTNGFSVSGVELEIKKGIPLNSGLGSSAASAVAGAIATNRLFGNILDDHDVVEAALYAERCVSGFHADNVLASFYGGIIAVNVDNPSESIHLPTSINPTFCVVKPLVGYTTKDARAVLPNSINLHDHIKNLSLISQLIHSLYTENLELFSKSMNDIIIEPSRSKLIPFFDEIKRYGFQLGGKSVTLSGSGPSISILSVDQDQANTIGKTIVDFWKLKNIESEYFVLTVSEIGAREQLSESIPIGGIKYV